MRMRALSGWAFALCALAFVGCSSSSGNKDGAATKEGPQPDAPSGREGSLVDRSLIDRATGAERTPGTDAARVEGGTKVDKGKPDATTAFCGSAKVLRCDCYGLSHTKNKFIPLWGKAQQVKFNGDFKVRLVTALGQLKVKQVTVLPSACGDWQDVSVLPDFTYELVTVGEDFTIQYVTVLPGLNKASCPSCP